jgi:predicted nucleic acid-binding protein
MILVDTSPLVALIHADGRSHDRCKEALKSTRGPFATVWPVFTEAVYLLNFSWKSQDALGEMVSREFFTFLHLDETDVPRMRKLMGKYRDLPMDFADATVVRVAEREKIRTVFTLDRRDFRSYRPARIGCFSIVP